MIAIWDMNERALSLKAHSPVKETLKAASNSLRFKEICPSSLLQPHPTPPTPPPPFIQRGSTLPCHRLRSSAPAKHKAVIQKAKEFVNLSKFRFPEAGRIEGSSGGAKTHMRRNGGEGLSLQ